MQLAAKEKISNLPLFREELRLLPAANNSDGSPAWMIQDPIVNKFYRIGWIDYEILLRWHLSEVSSIVQAVNGETILHIEDEDVLELCKFLRSTQLLQAHNAASVDYLTSIVKNNQKNIFSWLLHHYLFFRIPLIKPQKLLARCLPWISWIYTKKTAFIVTLITISGLFLAARQWDTFAATFIDQISLAGLLSYGIALLFSKCLHELGHAFTATRYGVRVAHMGIAMLVMFPMPYTDTSESWKLHNPTQRLHIAAAGIITELALAGIATLAWSLAPEGAFKNALFFLATTSWVLTLLVNMSPFMRFDGYFILSDLLDFPNLHERSGAFAKTWLRRTVLGVEDDWPEDFSIKKRRSLIIFSTVTWLYRITVFIAIAWLVYYYFFKVLGIILFIVEILWFVILPIWNELKVWYARRNEIKMNRKIRAAAVIITLVIVGFIPWQTNTVASAWVHVTKQSIIYTPIAGKLVNMHTLGAVHKNDSLFELTSPDIALLANKSKEMANSSGAELRGLIGLDDGESQRAQLQLKQEKFDAEVKLFNDELSRMDLTAPFDGVLLDKDESLSIGSWKDTKQPLAILIDPNSWVADVMVMETDIKRIHLNNTATIYIQDNQLNKFTGKVIEIDQSQINKLPHPMLDAQFGGMIATLPNNQSIPTQAYYKVRIKFDTQPPLQKMTLAKANIKSEAKAVLPKFFERIAAIFIRESGF